MRSLFDPYQSFGFTEAAIYFLLAVIPAVFLMGYIYKKDKAEKEPGWLLGRLLISGIYAALLAIIGETIVIGVIDRYMDPTTNAYAIVTAFIGVALVEEGAKFICLKSRTWKTPHFNYLFDGIVYAVFVSLGFAAFENVSYVFTYGMDVVLPRALLSIPGHMAFAVFMGAFYGRARLAENNRDYAAALRYQIHSLIAAILFHGTYDAMCMVDWEFATYLFGIFVIAMYFMTIKMVNTEARYDQPIY